MTAAPKHRWFRFSLRTLFAVVTLAAIPLGWLTWQIQIVRQRKAVFAEVTKLFPEQLNFQGDILPHFQVEDFELARISWIRRLLGDRPRHCINLSRATDRKLIERAERAFPEAEIYV